MIAHRLICRSVDYGYLLLQPDKSVADEATDLVHRIFAWRSDGSLCPFRTTPLTAQQSPDHRPGLIVAFKLYKEETYSFSVFSLRNGELQAEERFSFTSEALKWRSRFNYRFHKKLCYLCREIDERNHGDDDRCKVIQIFDGEKGSIYRVLRVGVDCLDREPVLIEQPDGTQTSSMAMVLERFALKDHPDVPCAILSFQWDDPGEGCCFQMADQYGECIGDIHYGLIFERDMAMVNPGIDGLYHEWIARYDQPLFGDPENAGSATLDEDGPLFSIVTPLFHTPLRFLRDLLHSVSVQTYGKWELILVNASSEDEELGAYLATIHDERVRIIDLEENRSIPENTNVGIEAARGDYVGFLDHDDMLAPTTLEDYARAILAEPAIDLLYCDEDSFIENDDDRFEPRFKPGLNPDLLLSHNYFVHFLVVRNAFLQSIVLPTQAVNGAQDYDISLKALLKGATIKHVPKVLYHWRAAETSTNGGNVAVKSYVIEAGRKAIASYFEQRGITPSIIPSWIPCVYDIDYHVPAQTPIVTWVIVSRDARRCERLIRSLSDFVSAHEVNVIVVNEKSDGDATPAELDRPIRRITGASSDVASMVREAASLIDSGVVLVSRDSISVENKGAMEQLLAAILDRNDVGIVAPKMFYRDELVQHAGMYLDVDQAPRLINQNFTASMGGGYLGYAECCCDYTSVSPDCLLIRAESLKLLRSFGDADGAISIADLCLQLHQEGKLTAVLAVDGIVNEAPVLWAKRSQYAPEDPVQEEALKRFWSLWRDAFDHDVLYNPNVIFSSGYPRLNLKSDT